MISRADGVQGLTDPHGRRPTAARSARCEVHHPARLGVRPAGAGGASGFYFEVGIRSYDLMLRCLAHAHAGPLCRPGISPRSAAR